MVWGTGESFGSLFSKLATICWRLRKFAIKAPSARLPSISPPTNAMYQGYSLSIIEKGTLAIECEGLGSAETSMWFRGVANMPSVPSVVPSKARSAEQTVCPICSALQSVGSTHEPSFDPQLAAFGAWATMFTRRKMI